MCGRFTLTTEFDRLAENFSFRAANVSYSPRYNISPSQSVLTIIDHEGEHRAGLLRWGLIPSWAKDSTIGNRMINARAETVAEKPMFREAFKYRRCVIPASGYYEWQDVADGKQPWYFTARNNDPIVLIAGLWESWRNVEPPHDTVRSATMVITEPNQFVARLHDRMPVLLTRETMGDWLSGAKGRDLCKPAPEDAVQAWPVARKVNSSKAPDEPGLIERIELPSSA